LDEVDAKVSVATLRLAARAEFLWQLATLADCTSSAKGRSITIHPHEAARQRAKAAQ